MATTKTPDPAPDSDKPDPNHPAWMDDPTFNRNESQNYVEPEDREKAAKDAESAAAADSGTSTSGTSKSS